jgi:hypothetical protein
MSREDAIKLAQNYGQKFPQSYTSPDFEPHEWVIHAIQAAYRDGYEEGFDDGF